MAKRLTGVVKFFNGNKGYGFIKPDNGTADVFIHITALKRSKIDALKENDRVEFDAVDSRKEGRGPEAENLVVL
jgi:CspA family cold shock protein